MNRELEQAYDIIESLNGIAHDRAWDLWVEADEISDSAEDDDDWSRAEDMREEASLEQALFFREEYSYLSSEDQALIVKCLSLSEDFKEDFKTYFGEAAFDDEF